MKKSDLVKIIKEEIQSILSEAAMPKRNVMYVYTTTEDGKTTKTKVKFVGVKRGSVPLQPWKGEMTFYQFRVYDKDGKPSKKATSIFVDPKKFTPANFKEVPVKVTEAAKERPIGSVEVMEPGKTYVFAGGYITDDKQDEVTMKYEGLVGKKMKFTITKSTKYPQNVGHEILLTTKQVTFAINKLPYVKGLEEGKINESKVYKIETINKNGKSTIHHLPADSMLDVNRTVELLKKSKNIADVKILGIKESLEEADSDTYTYAHDPKSNKYNVIKVSDGATVTSFTTEDQAKSHVEKINKLSKGYDKIKGKVYEGPEEMGAYRRLVITSPLMDKIKAEYTKFMARPEVKSMYPVRFKMIDSPKPDTFVVDVEGEKATVVAIKLSDLAKKLDKSVAIMVRKERKLK